MSDIPRYRTLPLISHDNYFQWQRDVKTYYGNFATDIYTHGLTDLICTDAEWQALPGNIATTARPVRDLPGNLPDNASAAVVAVYNRLTTNRSRALGLISEAKECLIQSIGKTNVSKLRHAVTDMKDVTELQIITAMNIKYSKLSTTALLKWKQFLTVPIGASEDIEDFLASHKNIYDNLKCVGQPMSEYDSIETTITALATRTAAGLAITQYKIEKPDVNGRNFADFTDFLVEQAPNMPVTVSTMSYAAHSSPDAAFEARVAAAVDARLELAIDARFVAMGFAAAATAPTRSSKSSALKYCYRHGYT